jgi:valyl-tRNA synthetase
MAPFIPHVTDAVYMGAFRATDGHSSVHISPWPEAHPAWVTLQDASAIAIGDAILAVIDSSRRWKSDRALSVAAPIGPLIVTAPSPICDALRLASTDLLGVTRASSLALVAGGGDGVHVEITAPAS